MVPSRVGVSAERLVEIDPGADLALRRELLRWGSLQKEYQAAVMTEPLGGSQAAKDLADDLRAYAYDHAATAISATMDHLRSWRFIYKTRTIPHCAQWSLLRTAHESALTARWLLDLGIGPDDRRARGMAAYWENLEERRKFEESCKVINANPPGMLAKARQEDLLKRAAALQMTTMDKRRRLILAVRMPSIVELFDHYETTPKASGQSYYRLYSGYAHAKQWAMTLGVEQATPLDANNRAGGFVVASDDLMVWSTRHTTDSVADAIKSFSALRN